MKRIFKIVISGTCLGLILVIIQKVFQIDEDAFLRGYWIAAPAIVIGAVLANVFYNISYQRKMRAIAELLDAGKPKEYIAEAEKLLQTAKGQNLRNILKLNLAAGYIDIKQYDTSICILEELSGKRLPGSAVKMVHRLNLCMSYFYAGQYEKAMELYHGSRKIFETYRNSRIYGGNIAVVDILVAIQNEQYEQAEKMLLTAQKSWSGSRLQEAFQIVHNFLGERKANVSCNL